MNLNSFIHLSETLLVELTRTHHFKIFDLKKKKSGNSFITFFFYTYKVS